MKSAFALLCFAATVSAAEYTWWAEECKTRQESGCEAGDAELVAWALADWERYAAGKVWFRRVAREQEARLRIRWVAAGAGTFGEIQRFLFEGGSGAEVYIRPDAGALGERLRKVAAADPLFRTVVVYLTCLHETGHAIGLRHTRQFEDIMYSFQYGGDPLAYFARYRRRLTGRQAIPVTSGLSENEQLKLPALLP